MTNKDLISQYVNLGVGIPEYQFNKLNNNDKKTYLRKIVISAKYDYRQLEYYYGEIPEDVQLAAVNQDGFAIRYIDNPSEKVQLIAVKKDGQLINDILKKGIRPSEEVQLAAVNKQGAAIEYIKNPSEKLQLIAVNQNGYAIRYIKNPSERVKRLAMNKKDS